MEDQVEGVASAIVANASVPPKLVMPVKPQKKKRDIKELAK
jgi:hypothetical protein